LPATFTVLKEHTLVYFLHSWVLFTCVS